MGLYIDVIKFCFYLVCFSTSASSKKAGRHDCRDEPGSNSFLWAIRRDPPAYFFGTIHVPYTRVWNQISQTAKEAFLSSEDIYFELDLTDAETLSALTHCQMLPGETGLKEVLPHDIYQRLKRHLDYVKDAMSEWVTSEQKGKGLYPDTLFEAIVGNWEKKKPIWVMLMVNSLTETDIKTRGTPVLDLYLARKAANMGKTVGAVERVEEQCQPLNGLNMSQVLFALNHTLMVQEKMRRGIVKAPYTTDDLIEQYNCGKLDSVMFDKDSVQVPKMDNQSRADVTGNASKVEDVMAMDIDSYFKNELIYHRNERMASRIKHLLEAYPQRSFFFAIGAGHFLGNGSVIDFLRSHKYEIESVKKDISYRNVIQVQGTKGKNRNKRKRKRRKNDRRATRRESRQRSKLRKNDGRRQSTSDFLTSYKRTTFNFFPTFNGDLQIDRDYALLDKADIRVISYRPTRFPSNFYKRRLKKIKRFYSNHKSDKRRKKQKKPRQLTRTATSPLSADLNRLNDQLWHQVQSSRPTSGSKSNQVKDLYIVLSAILLGASTFLLVIL